MAWGKQRFLAGDGGAGRGDLGMGGDRVQSGDERCGGDFGGGERSGRFPRGDDPAGAAAADEHEPAAGGITDRHYPATESPA
jgi:hypothetical protein